MRQLASVQEIAEVQPIEGADKIEKVRINGWWCVAKKGEFKEGEPCVYFEVDSLLPESNPAFSFLAKGNSVRSMTIDGKEYRGYRLKTVRLRGQVSQGLALPLESFGIGAAVPVGADLTDTLGVVKYEAPIPACLAGKVKGQFPSFIPKTDEERIQNCPNLLTECANEPLYITEKLDGSSVTFYKHCGVFGVCSRNLELYETEDNTFWEMARKYDLENALPDGYALQGEVIGSGIQGNRYNLNGHDVYFFNLYSIVEGRHCTEEELTRVLALNDLKMVPYVGSTDAGRYSLATLLLWAEGRSALADTAREGLVFRTPGNVMADIGGTRRRLSFKVISNSFLLDNE